LPYFKAQEDNDHLTCEFHGVGGPLKISNLGHTSPMTFPIRLPSTRCSA
jgi:choline dehydrogenase